MTPIQEAKNPETSPERLAQLALLEEKIAREVAKNISTPPEALKLLGSSRDDTTRKYVAGNPNTPLEVFSKLAMQFPKEVLNNPLLPILLMSDANFLEQFPSASLKNMLKRPEMPVEFIEWAAQNADWNACEGILQNEKATLSALQRLEQRFPKHKKQIQNHVAFADGSSIFAWTVQDLMAEINKKSKHHSESSITRVGWFSKDHDLLQMMPILTFFRCDLAKDVSTSDDMLHHLARDANFFVRVSVAQSSKISPGLLRILAADEFAQIREIVSIHPLTPIDVLEILATDLAWQVRLGVKQNPSLSNEDFVISIDARETPKDNQTNLGTSLEWLIQRAKHIEWTVRARVARDRNTPAELLTQLAFDQEPRVKKDVAANANTSSETLQFLFESERDQEILRCLASNPNTPQEALSQLSKSFPHSVARNISTSASILLQLCELKDPELHIALAQNSATPAAVLEKLIAISNPFLSREIVAHPNTPKVTLGLLAADPFFIPAIANNPSIPESLIEAFAEHESAEVRYRIAKNPSAITKILLRLSRDQVSGIRGAVAQNPYTPFETLQLLARDKEHSVRYAVAQHPNAPTEAIIQFGTGTRVYREELWELALDQNKWIRTGVASNLCLPKEILQQLALDKDTDVRLAIASNWIAPFEILHLLVSDKKWQIRRAVAMHKNTTSPTLELLVQDAHKAVRLEVAKHWRTPFAALQILATDSDKAIQEAVLLNSSLSREQRTQLLLQMGLDFSLELEKLLTSLSKSKETSYVPYVHPQAPTPVLAKAGRHNDPLVRAAIALNPKTPESTLKILCQDGDARVRATALARVKGTP